MNADGPGLDEALRQVELATSARKCAPCGCFHGAIEAIESHLPPDRRASLDAARAWREPVRYDCLGCEECWPANAVRAVGAEASCAAAEVADRSGWPPVPGDYVALRYRAPVAVCALYDEALARAVAESGESAVSISGNLRTENLGIERLVRNLVANPNIRFLVVCGEDSQRAVGHLPGASLVALARNGVGEDMRIAAAPGRRPVLKNISRDAVDHFRRTVEVIDRVGERGPERVLEEVRACARRDPGPAEPFAAAPPPAPVAGRLPGRLVLDPAGYFVIDVDRRRGRLVVEHYRSDGALDAIVEGATAAETWTPAIDGGMVSRLDHAAYLGRELARAELALADGGTYVQDAAPVRCGCGSACGEDRK